MSKTKVAFLLISPGKAGVENVVRQIIKGLDTSQTEPYLICSAEIAPYFNSLLDKAHVLVLGTFFKRPKGALRSRLYPFINNRLQLENRKLKRWSVRAEKFLDRNGIRIMHAHLVWDYFIASEIRKRRADLAYINTMHGTLALDPADDYYPFFERSQILGMLSNADVFTSACRYFFDLLRLWRIAMPKNVLIPNGIETDESEQMPHAAHTFVWCFMGGGRPHQKGGDLLMHALYHLIHTFGKTEFKLLVYGNVTSGSKDKMLAEQLGLNPYIEWRGFVEPPAHLDGLRAADAFVLPSRHEGVANTLMEAIGLGLPVVATRVGGTPEYIKDGENGLLCYPDAMDIAVKLNSLMNDTSLQEKMRRNNLEVCRKYFWDEICNAYAALYRETALEK